ncbi:sugar ABC transporter substrate-binding protein [Trinickia terrae]|uniref:Sugar ABC transporter substrate-binding protein n=1 Tax=Trinickia terrae TaxID=2571161 RepID=A0A4U1HE93_9BURK|nr:ABC transporter substrate-binding protein [Trinickia terrae]TKC78078.1 sugar ABC transporter substrate-binding protein [Trinickia terrae]
MKRRDALLSGALTVLSAVVRPVAAAERPPRVVFLNPGEAVERGTGQQWQLVSKFMLTAARSFGMQLEVLYAERDHLLMLRQAEQVAQRGDPPDYVVIVNEKMTAAQMLTSLAKSPARVLVMHNDLTIEQRGQIGNERERIANWIGTLTADAGRGACRLMQYLCATHGPTPARVLGITGDPVTPVSNERAAGVEAWLSGSGQGRTFQLVNSDWSHADAYEKASVLLARYPEANILWAANDAMTLGALQAVKERRAPVLVGGLGALPEAVRDVIGGDLSAMVAGDYFIGAFAMVLLHDYHQGNDFAAAGGARQKLDFLKVIHRGNAERFDEIVFKRDAMLDFAQYSRVRHTRAGRYDFDLQRLLNTRTKVS